MEKFRKVWNVITTVIVALIVVVAAMLVVPNLIGIKSYYVISGSMEPTIPTGSLIYVVDQDFESIQVGDILTYKSGSAVVTHRAYQIFYDEHGKITSVRTKGDANESPDGSDTQGNVTKSNLIGKTAIWIPVLGYLAFFFQTSYGVVAIIALAAFVILMIFLPDIIKLIISDDKDKEKNKEAAQPSDTETKE